MLLRDRDKGADNWVSLADSDQYPPSSLQPASSAVHLFSRSKAEHGERPGEVSGVFRKNVLSWSGKKNKKGRVAGWGIVRPACGGSGAPAGSLG